MKKKKIIEKIYSFNEKEISVTHGESRGNSQRKHTFNKNLYYAWHCFKMYVFKKFIQNVTNKVLTLRRKTADSNKGVAFR